MAGRLYIGCWWQCWEISGKNENGFLLGKMEETAWELRKIAEGKELLWMDSGKSYDMEDVANKLLHDDTVKCIVCNYLEEIRNSQEDSANGNG